MTLFGGNTNFKTTTRVIPSRIDGMSKMTTVLFTKMVLGNFDIFIWLLFMQHMLRYSNFGPGYVDDQ